MLSKYLAQVVFGAALLLSLLSIGMLFVMGDMLLWLIALSVAFNLWSIVKSDRDGFVASAEMRRAFEPARHFNSLQTFAVLALVMAQIGFATYMILE